ncbi:recombinase family protein [Erwinia tracheiphila]|uniref:recombinase family protein n=1 Tax=Erwinia tracheiphila TaxID=65700 RepID=UPI001F441556|nr:recombinase family protein [Erwinia tracheiphila]UIA85505.1 recombinase family protein [Erwinia tracheiphila]UIA94027.1 recombinase family protein [Erwinia tracheiphila]
MTEIRIGYARCSTDSQDLAAQQEALTRLCVSPDRIYTDKGLTGSHRQRPGPGPGSGASLCQSWTGWTVQSRTPERLRTLSRRGVVKLALGNSVYDPADPMGKMFFNVLATFAEFEGDIIRLRIRERMAITRTKGKLKGKQPKLSDRQQQELCRMYG